MRSRPLLTLALLLATLSAPATQAADANDLRPAKENDPWQSVNQPVFNFNVGFDRYFAKPVITVYHKAPSDMRHGVDNFLTNLSEPLNVIHGVLQLNPRIAFTSLWRFILNSTFGLAGFRDFAAEQKLYNLDQDFGKTMGRWGVGAGPYVVLPVLGPSSVRDTAGKAGDFFLDPVGWYFSFPAQVAQGVADGIDTRDKDDAIIDHLYYQSLDPYVATRSSYRQHEAFEVNKKE